jgi:hypothetical protein
MYACMLYPLSTSIVAPNINRSIDRCMACMCMFYIYTTLWDLRHFQINKQKNESLGAFKIILDASLNHSRSTHLTAVTTRAANSCTTSFSLAFEGALRAVTFVFIARWAFKDFVDLTLIAPRHGKLAAMGIYSMFSTALSLSLLILRHFIATMLVPDHVYFIFILL